MRGGETGPVVVPGDPDKSRLIERGRLRRRRTRCRRKAKLPDAEIAALDELGQDRAHRGRGIGTAGATAKDEFDLARRKAEHWAWQPVAPRGPRRSKDTAWPVADLDRFMLAKLEAKGLRPAPTADRRDPDAAALRST